MKITIFKSPVYGKGEIVQQIDLDTLITTLKDNAENEAIGRFRRDYLTLTPAERLSVQEQMPRVCVASEYHRNREMERVFSHYNGLAAVKIGGLGTSLEVEKAKRQASVLPQVLLTFAGVDGHSVVVVTRSVQADGSLPQTAEKALLHHARAYATAVMSLQPLLEFQIEVEEPALDSVFTISADAEPYYNPNAPAFIVEQPSPMALAAMVQSAGVVQPLKNLRPGADAYCTITTVYNAAYLRALEKVKMPADGDVEPLILCVAEECCKVGVPEEDCVKRTSFHFPDRRLDDIRSSVRTVYEQHEGGSMRRALQKHQLVAYRLREFLDRRYDIRFNEVLQMTEYREKNSLWFDYRELGRRELNTIHYEALLEGIEPSFGELDELVHSTYVKLYNPIEYYLGNLPAWDGRDRIADIARRVPTDNPHWQRLFRQWLLSMVAHWMNGDEQHANSTAPILIGAQGYRKSTFCRLLLPPQLQMFYTDSIDFRTNIEAERTLSRFLLVNIDEFDQLSEKQFTFVKHLFQKPATNIRRMYSEAIGQQRRYASFVGTTNSEEVLRDPTGNRRYLCVQVKDVIDTETPINHLQLYAQLVHLINNGERYWLNDEDEALIKQTNVHFEKPLPLEELFASVYSKADEDGEGSWMSLPEMMAELQKQPGFNRRRDNDLMLLSKVLNKMKAPKHRITKGMVYKVKPVAQG